MSAAAEALAKLRESQVGLYAVVHGPDRRGSIQHRLAWCVIKAYHAEEDLFTVKTARGEWLQFCPGCLQVAAAPIEALQVVS